MTTVHEIGASSVLLALVLGGCTGEPVVVAELDSPVVDEPMCGGVELRDRYTPAGTVVADATECPAWPASCPYLCRSPVCAATDGAVSCEPCAELHRFNEYDGEGGCRWLRVDEGAFSHACD